MTERTPHRPCHSFLFPNKSNFYFHKAFGAKSVLAGPGQKAVGRERGGTQHTQIQSSCFTCTDLPLGA